MDSGIPSAARTKPPRYSCKRPHQSSAMNGCRSFVLNTMWKCRLKWVDGIRDYFAERDLNFHQTRAVFDVAERRRKLARHEVSGQRRNKFRPGGTTEINLIWRSLFRFHRPFRTGFLLPRYQTLRVWLISGCAFGTSRSAPDNLSRPNVWFPVLSRSDAGY